jgi:hypothetical protein
MARIRLAVLLLAVAAAGGAVGFAAGARKAFDEGYAFGSLDREVLAGGEAVMGLRFEEENGPDGVTDWLEFKLDMALVIVHEYGAELGDPPFYAPRELRESRDTKARSLQGLATYRKAHPRTSKFPELDARVREAVERYASSR